MPLHHDIDYYDNRSNASSPPTGKKKKGQSSRQAKEQARKMHEEALKREEELLKKEEDRAHREEERRHKEEDRRRRQEEEKLKASLEGHKKLLERKKEDGSNFRDFDDYDEDEEEEEGNIVERDFAISPHGRHEDYFRHDRKRSKHQKGHEAPVVHRSGYVDMDFSEDEAVPEDDI